MSRPRHTRRPVLLHTNLPEDVRARLDIELFSEVEGRVPLGAYSRFLSERISEYFSSAALDLSPWLDPTGSPLLIRGSPRAIDTLTEFLQRYV